MGEVNYLPLIEEMTWSYSRVESYESCPYGFFLRYITHSPSIDKFFASYGTWMHTILEKYYAGNLSEEDMLVEYLVNFEDQVRGIRPRTDTVQKYIEGGSEYLKNFERLPYDILEVEKNVSFEIDDLKFVGRIDLLGEDDGKLYLIDHKSGDIRPRSKKTKPTVKDAELDKKLRQLYLYSTAIYKEYGRFPEELCFNCFRTGIFIKERFDFDAYQRTIDWIKSEIQAIRRESDFYPKCDFFYCRYICGMSDDCIYNEMVKE